MWIYRGRLNRDTKVNTHAEVRHLDGKLFGGEYGKTLFWGRLLLKVLNVHNRSVSLSTSQNVWSKSGWLGKSSFWENYLATFLEFIWDYSMKFVEISLWNFIGISHRISSRLPCRDIYWVSSNLNDWVTTYNLSNLQIHNMTHLSRFDDMCFQRWWRWYLSVP